MKDLRIDGRMQRVFVLLETDERMVYIPVKSLHRVDYDFLIDLEDKWPRNMLEGLKKSKLPNGRNALVQYENIIQVLQFTGKGNEVRIKKPHERQPEEVQPVQVEVVSAPTPTVEAQPVQVEAPARKKPGPKPKNK